MIRNNNQKKKLSDIKKLVRENIHNYSKRKTLFYSPFVGQLISAFTAIYLSEKTFSKTKYIKSAYTSIF